MLNISFGQSISVLATQGGCYKHAKNDVIHQNLEYINMFNTLRSMYNRDKNDNLKLITKYN